jgi:hypothetical protein
MPKRKGLFPWPSPKKEGYSLGCAQERRVITLVVPKKEGSFSWLCPNKIGYSLGREEKRVIILVMPKEGGSFHWLSPGKKGLHNFLGPLSLDLFETFQVFVMFICKDL